MGVKKERREKSKVILKRFDTKAKPPLKVLS